MLHFKYIIIRNKKPDENQAYNYYNFIIELNQLLQTFELHNVFLSL